MKFIENKEENGMLYNEYLVQKEYDKLKIPTKYYRPPFAELSHHKYFIGLSERATGKTTNWLLYGMCKYKIYGAKIIYVRQTRDMIAPKFSMEVFNVILEYNNGEYIRKLTDGKYNSIRYDKRRYYYCLRDSETNEVIEQSEDCFMHCVSIDDAMLMKSTFNVPRGDVILFDEFIGKHYAFNEAIQFFDLCSTIIRKRLSPIIVMVANTINLHSEYFYELEIKNKIKDMTYGDKKSIKTDLGTSIFIEIIKIQESEEYRKRREHNAMFFGFKSPKLTSITGGGDVWAYEHVPHICKYDKDGNRVNKSVIDIPKIYLKNGDDILLITLMYSDLLGHFMEVTKTTYTDKDKDRTIYLVDNRQDILYNNEYKSLSYGSKLYKLIEKYNTLGKIYFQNNEIGSIFYDYIDKIK